MITELYSLAETLKSFENNCWNKYVKHSNINIIDNTNKSCIKHRVMIKVLMYVNVCVAGGGWGGNLDIHKLTGWIGGACGVGRMHIGSRICGAF